MTTIALSQRQTSLDDRVQQPTLPQDYPSPPTMAEVTARLDGFRSIFSVISANQLTEITTCSEEE